MGSVKRGKKTTLHEVSQSQPIGAQQQKSAYPLVSVQQVLSQDMRYITTNCNLCNDSIQDVQVGVLQCCLCDMYFHAICCNIDESLLDDLNVIRDVGGWCCISCRSLKRTVKTTRVQTDTQNFFANIDLIKLDLSKVCEHLNNISSSLGLTVAGFPEGGAKSP